MEYFDSKLSFSTVFRHSLTLNYYPLVGFIIGQILPLKLLILLTIVVIRDLAMDLLMKEPTAFLGTLLGSAIVLVS
jgi:hypothetical protein